MDTTKFSLEPFFLHKNLCYSILPKHMQLSLELEVSKYEQSGSPSATMYVIQAYTEHLEKFLTQHHLYSIEEHVSKRQLKEGQLVWTNHTFQFKGTAKSLLNLENYGKASYAEFYSIETIADELR